MGIIGIVLLLAAQKPEQEAAAQAQAASVQKQRDAVKRQVKVAVAVEESFFTAPFAITKIAVFDTPPMLSPAMLQEPECDPVSGEHLRNTVDKAAMREGLTPDLLRAVINRESAFQPCAVSSKGAQGLMQLMPATQAQFGVTNAFDVRQNVDAGARLLKQLLERYGGDLALALGAYNAGPERVDRAGGVPLIPETMSYVYNILQQLVPISAPARVF